MNFLSILQFLPPSIKVIICAICLTFGIFVLRSGLRKERKSFFWIGGIDSTISNPLFNIFYGILLILLFSLGIIWYAAEIK